MSGYAWLFWISKGEGRGVQVDIRLSLKPWQRNLRHLIGSLGCQFIILLLLQALSEPSRGQSRELGTPVPQVAKLLSEYQS